MVAGFGGRTAVAGWEQETRCFLRIIPKLIARRGLASLGGCLRPTRCVMSDERCRSENICTKTVGWGEGWLQPIWWCVSTIFLSGTTSTYAAVGQNGSKNVDVGTFTAQAFAPLLRPGSGPLRWRCSQRRPINPQLCCRPDGSDNRRWTMFSRAINQG